jgi:hypothetical protein
MMHPSYFETRFRVGALPDTWPEAFAIVTAYATTGERWSDAANASANRHLVDRVVRSGLWHWPITGYSPTTGHAEPGWGIELDWESACGWGGDFLQDAIYFVAGDELFVSHCDTSRGLISVGPFRERLDLTHRD